MARSVARVRDTVPRMARVTVTGLDHIVLLCADVEQSLDWYTNVLGLTGERVDEWRRGETFFPSVRITATTIIDLFPRGDAARPDGATKNLDHFCLVIAPADLDALAASDDVDVASGPTEGLFGAQGYARSLYVRDPDGNTVELRNYG
jgi:catechol 2,3-dioxygenase-like lactoylglutathione lyase family enzyme